MIPPWWSCVMRWIPNFSFNSHRQTSQLFFICKFQHSCNIMLLLIIFFVHIRSLKVSPIIWENLPHCETHKLMKCFSKTNFFFFFFLQSNINFLRNLLHYISTINFNFSVKLLYIFFFSFKFLYIIFSKLVFLCLFFFPLVGF